MADHDAIDLAFRARLSALVICTTGAITLAATSTGYTRTSGSFVTDGFVVGYEVTPSGFTQTATGVVTAVSALTLTIDGGRIAQAAASGRALSVTLPALRAWDNLDFTPVPGRPFVEADFVPGPHTLRTGPAQGGVRETDGLYVVRWYGLANTGASNIRKAVGALEALFTPGTTFAAGSHTVRIQADRAPFASQITQRPGGWALCTYTIPWRVWSANVVVA